MKTMLTNSLRKMEARYRSLWLVGGVAVSAVILLVPVAISGPTQIPPLLALLQILACGLVVGLARQGVDVLVIRLLISAEALFLGDLLARAAAHSSPVCAGPLDCFETVLLGAVGFGLFGAVLIGLVAFPTTVLWNRGASSLKPELRWRSAPRPRTLWQWGIVLGVLLVVFAAVKVLYVIPSP